MFRPNQNYLTYFPNAELPISDYRSTRSSCLRAGAFIVMRKIIKDYKLEEILGMYFKDRDLGLFLDLAVYSIITEDNASQYYPDYAYNHPLFTQNMKIYSDSTVSAFLQSVTEDQNAGFLNEWNGSRNHREKKYISYDSTNKNSQAGDVEIVEYGKPKVDIGFPVFNYAVGYDVNNREPLFYEKYPGSIVDISQLKLMLNKAQGYGYKKVGFILDRGYFSKQNIEHMHESVQPHGDLDNLTPDEIIEIVKEAGIVGMGGAGFPTCVKLKPAKPVDTILLNGCECEPYLTADHKVLLEFADDIIFGLKAILKTTGAEKGIIVIEDNKPDAIELMKEKVADIGNMEVFVARTKYPQGAEKTLIKRVMGRKVPSGGLPADVGVIVDNISTVKAISDAIQKGMPLIERVTTITGEKIKNPGNFIIKIGTSVKDLIDYCGGFTDDDVLVKMGGPMMGFPLNTLDVPMMKGSNGIIAIDTDETKEQPCIKCGRCVDVCPMELSPLYFVKYAKEENWQGMKDMNVMDCVECRCCQYICSSKIPIINSIKAGKNAVRGMK